MKRRYKSSRYGIDSPLGFRTLRQIREEEKREKKKTMSSEDRKKIIEDAKKSKP